MSVKKNICITINSLEMGGAEKQSVLLAQALNPFHNVTLVVIDPNKEVIPARSKVLEAEGITPIFLPNNTIKKFVTLTNIMKMHRIEYVFSFLATDMVLSAICGKLAKVPYRFGGIRSSSWPKLKFMTLRAVHNYLLNYTISNNYAGYQIAVDFGFKKNIFVIPNGIEIRPRLARSLGSKATTIISLGRLVTPKRYDIAVKTIAHLKTLLSKDYLIKYKIVGQGPEEDSIRETIGNLGMQKEIEVITDATDMYALLDAADIYLCTSSFEGISNALMEAMNCALSIVATDVGDNARLVVDTKNGFLTEVNDIQSIALKLKYLIENPNQNIKMGQVGYGYLKEQFSLEAFQKKYLDIIENIDYLYVKDGGYFIKKNHGF